MQEIPEFSASEHSVLLRKWVADVCVNVINQADLLREMTALRRKRGQPLVDVPDETLLKRLCNKTYRNSGSRSHKELLCLWDFLKQHPVCVRHFPHELFTDPSPPLRSRINVSGRWKLTFLEKHIRDVTFEIEQKGEKLRGVSTHIKNDKTIPGDDKRQYDLEGRRYENFVLLNGISRSLNEIAVNTFLLEIVGAGNKMCGAVAAYNTEDGKDIFSLKCECTRLA